MTREEIIEYAEAKKAKLDEKMSRPENMYGAYAMYSSELEFTSAAIAAIRAQQEQEINEPLTLDELRQMEGEPVWMAPVQKAGWISVPAQWTIFAGVSESISREPVYVFSTPRTPLEGMGGSYGQTWLAYRRKPKDTTEG